MVIGIDASRANQVHRTGTEWYSFHIIQHLKKIIPSEHTVVLYSKETLRDDLADLPGNWKSVVLRWPPGFLWTQLRLSIEMLLNKPDILYIPAHTIPLIHPKKIALVVHDVGFARQQELYDTAQIGYSQPLAKKLINAFVRLFTVGKYSATEQDYHRFAMDLACKYATRMITVSEFSKSEIIDVYHIPTERISVIHNGLNDLSGQNTVGAEVLRKFGIREGEPYLFFLGRVEQKKNVPMLIDAFALVKKQYGFTGQLVLAGSPGYRYEEVQSRIKTQGLTQDVIETGWTEESDVAALMKNAHVFVLPSLYEGFGIPVLEAMQVDVPVACSDIPALKEVAGNAALFFDPRSAQDMARIINQAATDNVERTRLKAAGHERVKQFSWEHAAQQTWQVIASL